mgnify:CR=1 FL=1
MVKPAAVSGYRHPRLDGGCGGRSASIGADSRLFPDTAEEEKKRGDQAVEEPITERPEPLPELELANLQGVAAGKNSRTLSASPVWIVMRKTGCSLCCATVWAVWRRAA